MCPGNFARNKSRKHVPLKYQPHRRKAAVDPPSPVRINDPIDFPPLPSREEEKRRVRFAEHPGVLETRSPQSPAPQDPSPEEKRARKALNASKKQRVLAWLDALQETEPLDPKLWVEDVVSGRVQWVRQGSGGMASGKPGWVGEGWAGFECE